jgi:hypothetical protein
MAFWHQTDGIGDPLDRPIGLVQQSLKLRSDASAARRPRLSYPVQYFFSDRGTAMDLATIKPTPKPRIGLYATGLKAYWAQFPGLRERPGRVWPVIANRLAESAEVISLA